MEGRAPDRVAQRRAAELDGQRELDLRLLDERGVLGQRRRLGAPRGDRHLVHGREELRGEPYRAAGGRGVREARALPLPVLAYQREAGQALERRVERVGVVGEDGAEGGVHLLSEGALLRGLARRALVAALQLEGRVAVALQLAAGLERAQPGLQARGTGLAPRRARGRGLHARARRRGLSVRSEGSLLKSFREGMRKWPWRRAHLQGMRPAEGHNVGVEGPAHLDERLGARVEDLLPRGLLAPEEAAAKPLALNGVAAPVLDPRRRPHANGEGNLLAGEERADGRETAALVAQNALDRVARATLPCARLDADGRDLGVGVPGHGHAHARRLLKPGDREHLLLHGRGEDGLDAVAQEDE